jgi:hypothetical protein
MRNAAALWMAWGMLWPLVSGASEVEVPELGITLMSLPSSADKPQVVQGPAGEEASTRDGAAVLRIYRDDAPVPAGSDVASPHYRALLDRKFQPTIESETQGAPTLVGGHSAWTVVDAHPVARSGLTTYTCITYLIVDQHLYRLTITAQGASARPPEFDSLVTAISNVKFAPVARASAGN